MNILCISCEEITVSRDAVLLFGLLDELFLLFDVYLLDTLLGLVIEHDQVAVAHVKAGQVIARVLRVENVLVHNVRGAFRLGRSAHTYLPDGTVLAEYVVHFLRRDLVGQVAHEQDAIDLGRQAHVRAILLHRHFLSAFSQRTLFSFLFSLFSGRIIL